MTKNLKYKNLTISGLPGAGSSTLGIALVKVLGWKYFSGGDFMRSYAIKKDLFDPKNKSHHPATVYSDDFDRQVDFGMRNDLKTKNNQILDSWLSGFMAQEVEETLKILIFCSKDSIRVDRITNRDNITIREAKQHIFERERKNVQKWRRMYHREWNNWVVEKGKIPKSKPIWFWYPELYDLTIDSYKNSKEETLNITLRALGMKSKKIDYHKVFSSQ